MKIVGKPYLLCLIYLDKIVSLASSFTRPHHDHGWNKTLRKVRSHSKDASEIIEGDTDLKMPRWKRRPNRMPSDIYAQQGDIVSLKCLADGGGDLVVQWYKKPLNDDSSAEMISFWTSDSPAFFKSFLDENGEKFRFRRNIKFNQVLPSDAGQYICVVSNQYGSINHTYTLHVETLPVGKPIVLPMENQTAVVGSNVTINCTVLNPNYSKTWWYKRNILNETKSYDQIGVDGALNLYSVTYEDSGQYFCISENRIGKSIEALWLNITPSSHTINTQSQRMSMYTAVMYVFYAISSILIFSILIYVFYNFVFVLWYFHSKH